MNNRPILKALAEKDYELLKQLGETISSYHQEQAIAEINKKKLPWKEWKVEVGCGPGSISFFYVVARNEEDIEAFITGELDIDNFAEKVMDGWEKDDDILDMECDWDCASAEVTVESCEETEWEHFEEEDYNPIVTTEEKEK